MIDLSPALLKILKSETRNPKSVVSKGTNGVLFRLLPVICLLLIMPTVSLGQSSVQRDQQALTVLEKSIATAGGTQQVSSIQNVTETGTVTYYWVGEPKGTVTVKCKGLNQFRIDADLPDGKRSIVVNGTGGSVAEASGSTSPIHPQSAADIGSMTFPFATLVAVIEESSTSLIFGGLVTHNGASVYDVRLQNVFTSQQDPSGLRAKREARDFYFDPETYLVVAIADQIYVGDRDISHEVIYSDYKPENGVSVPLTITETANGVKGFTMQINQVAFNSQMNDSDFAW